MEHVHAHRLHHDRALIAVVLSALFASGQVSAHGDAVHGKNAATPITVEEKLFGRTGDPKNAARILKIDMSDKMRFTPASLTFRQGETVKFVVRNGGTTMHEMVIGTMQELKEHAEVMKKHPGMQHEEPYMAHVAPGRTETMVWQFTKAGEFHFGCLVPGHLEAGMIGRIRVLAKGERK